MIRKKWKSALTIWFHCGMLTKIKCVDGEFPAVISFRERSFGARTQKLVGLSPWSLLFEFSVGECGNARYSITSARKGIQVVPRKVIFRPEHFAQGVFSF